MYFNDSKKAVTQLNGTVINGSQISVEFARTDAYHQKSHGRILMQLPVLYICAFVCFSKCLYSTLHKSGTVFIHAIYVFVNLQETP